MGLSVCNRKLPYTKATFDTILNHDEQTACDCNDTLGVASRVKALIITSNTSQVSSIISSYIHHLTTVSSLHSHHPMQHLLKHQHDFVLVVICYHQYVTQVSAISGFYAPYVTV